MNIAPTKIEAGMVVLKKNANPCNTMRVDYVDQQANMVIMVGRLTRDTGNRHAKPGDLSVQSSFDCGKNFDIIETGD